MKMPDDSVEAAAKDTASPPKKKLKQARLPFQILSPAAKPVEIKLRKRKASTTSDDLQIIEIGPDVKENQGVIPDKKSKLEHNEDTKLKLQEKPNITVSKEKDVSNKNTNSADLIDFDDIADRKNNTEVIEVSDVSEDSILDKRESIEDIKIEYKKQNGKKKGKAEMSDFKNKVKDNNPEQDKEKTVILEGIKESKEDINLDLSITSQDNLSTVTSCGSISESDNDEKNQSQDDSPASTSSPITPKSDRVKKKVPGSQTPKARNLTPKQLALKAEKKRLWEEKTRLKEEKKKKRAEEREERLRLKNEKEDEKRRDKEEKEKKRQAEIEAKNEEKRLKEEEKKAKEEERRKREEAKEEERRKKEEEKRLKEEAKKSEHRKSAAVFASFFVPKKVDSKSQGVEEKVEDVPDVVDKFMPFEVKGDMRLAPLVRKEFVGENKEQLDSVLKNQSDSFENLYVESLKSGKHVPGTCGKTWPIVNEEDDVIIIEAENPVERGGKEINEEKEGKKCSRRQRAKLLQFHENRRPPYWGTWTKKSREIRPRTPFNMDKTMLEYEVDSDDEWEEDEDGESLRGSDDEESQDENYEEDNDMFVPHGYLSDEEGQDEMEDMSPEAQKAKLKLLQLEFEAERNEKQERQKPHLIGCVWFRNSDEDPAKVGSHIAELFLPHRAVWEGELPVNLKIELPISKEESPSIESSSFGPKKRTVPESFIPKMITLLHGYRNKVKFLTKEIYNSFSKDEVMPQPSYKSISEKIKELATWTRCPAEEGPPLANKMCWFVSAEVREKYGLKDLKVNQSSPTCEYSLSPSVRQIDQSIESPLQAAQSPSPSITKFTKILSTEERQQQLLSSATKKSTVVPAAAVPKGKKRVSLISVGPGQELPKQRNCSLQTFLKPNSESKSEIENSQQSKTNTEKVQTLKQLPKTPKRITPISIPRKEPLQKPNDDDCIILSD